MGGGGEHGARDERHARPAHRRTQGHGLDRGLRQTPAPMSAPRHHHDALDRRRFRPEPHQPDDLRQRGRRDLRHGIGAQGGARRRRRPSAHRGDRCSATPPSAVNHARQLLEARGLRGTGLSRHRHRRPDDGAPRSARGTSRASSISPPPSGPTRSAAASSAPAPSAWTRRLATGVPQVVTPGLSSTCAISGRRSPSPSATPNRKFNHWSPNVTLMRTTPEENAEMGRIFARKLSASSAPVAVLVPLKGFSELDAPDKPFWWPEADQAFVDALRKDLRPDIPVILVDHNVNDPEFSEKATETCFECFTREEERHRWPFPGRTSSRSSTPRRRLACPSSAAAPGRESRRSARRRPASTSSCSTTPAATAWPGASRSPASSPMVMPTRS